MTSNVIATISAIIYKIYTFSIHKRTLKYLLISLVCIPEKPPNKFPYRASTWNTYKIDNLTVISCNDSNTSISNTLLPNGHVPINMFTV